MMNGNSSKSALDLLNKGRNLFYVVLPAIFLAPPPPSGGGVSGGNLPTPMVNVMLICIGILGLVGLFETIKLFAAKKIMPAVWWMMGTILLVTMAALLVFSVILPASSGGSSGLLGTTEDGVVSLWEEIFGYIFGR